MRLPGTWRSKQDYILGALDERETGQFLYLRALNRAGETEVVFLQGLEVWQRGEFRERVTLRSSRTPSRHVADAPKIGQTRIGRYSVLGKRAPITGETVELQLRAQAGNPFVLEIHAATSSSASYTASGCCKLGNTRHSFEVAGAPLTLMMATAVALLVRQAGRMSGRLHTLLPSGSGRAQIGNLRSQSALHYPTQRTSRPEP